MTVSENIRWWVFVLLACGQFTLRYVWRNSPFLDLASYARGSERLPYQNRALMSWVLHSIADNPHFGGILRNLAKPLPPDIRNPYSVVLLVVDFLAIVVAVLAARFALERLTGDSRFSAWCSLLLLYMSYFNLIVGYGMFMLPYDIVSLALFMVSVWLVLIRRYWSLLLVVALATLNRETAIFIPLFLGLYTWFGTRGQDSTGATRLRRWSPILPHIALQTLAWLALYCWLHSRFHGDSSDLVTAHNFFSRHLRQNLISLGKPPQWPLLLSLFGFTLPLFITRFDLISDRALARSTAIVLVLWTALMLCVGVIVEIRIFSELTAFVMPCVALILWNRWVKPANKVWNPL